ncbi:MAG: carboxypeptidase-like regulatory domain-containing protein [Vicinamibacterales bacterium]
MRSTVKALGVCMLTLLILCSHANAAQNGGLQAHGVVSDVSGAVLPGVTVVATAFDGMTVASALTNERGEFALELAVSGAAVPTVSLTFQLDGFSTKSVQIEVKPGVEPWITEVLTLAPRTETVVVYGRAPVAPPVPRVLPPPPPPPVLAPVPEHDRDSVCGPSMPAGDASFGTIRATRDGATNELYAQSDQLRIDGGTKTGLEVGRNYVVRRNYRVRGVTRDARLEHVAGVVQVVAADEHSALAVVVYACDALMRGDALAAFNPEPVRTPEPLGTPAYDDAAQILFADIGQQLGAPRRLMVIDRGSDSDVRVGQTLTLFRRENLAGLSPSVIGFASVVAVRGHSATIRVDQGRDAIDSGDWAAPQRYPPQPASAVDLAVVLP